MQGQGATLTPLLQKSVPLSTCLFDVAPGARVRENGQKTDGKEDITIQGGRLPLKGLGHALKMYIQQGYGQAMVR